MSFQCMRMRSNIYSSCHHAIFQCPVVRHKDSLQDSSGIRHYWAIGIIINVQVFLICLGDEWGLFKSVSSQSGLYVISPSFYMIFLYIKKGSDNWEFNYVGKWCF